MEPKSFSATSIQTAELCMSRYAAEHISYARGIGNTAANLGTAVHGALELFVKTVYLNKTEKASMSYLHELFRMQYMTVFSTGDTDTEEFNDGADMLFRWYGRTVPYLETTTVLSAEQKLNFPIKTPIGEKPFNYIYDRLDQIDENVYKIVDYKTNRFGVRPEDLKKRIQVRAYGLAAQITYPNAERIFVELDMLRHDGPVGVVITREDNIATWKFLKEKARQIVNTKVDDAMETLNPECRFCVRKQSCSALRKNINVGGIVGVGTAQDLVDARAALEYQKSAVEASIKELDELIITEAKQTDVLSWESADNVMEIGSSGRRSADTERVQQVLGPELSNKYCRQSITMDTINKLLKGTELTPEQKRDLKSMIFVKRGEARVSVKPRNPIDA